ncbi:MAG TPA: hypothetical protein VIY29_05555 [Ktedonobacteraceae bacterium]
MKHKIVRIAVFILAVFVALTAIVGSIGLLTGAISVSLAWLQGSPFNDYTIPGLALGLLVGGSSLFAAATIITGREVGVLASAFAGLMMMGFEIVEITVVDRFVGSWFSIAVALQAFYAIAGLAMFSLAAFLWMREYRDHHFPTRRVSHA